MRIPRHANEQRLHVRDLTGGVNLAVSPDDLENNELSLAVNWEYDTLSSLPKIRGGLGATEWCDTGMNKVDSLFFCPNRDFFLCSDGTTLKKAISTGASAVGTLAGSNIPIYDLWGEDNDVLIASGGKLQSYDGTTLVKYDGVDDPDTSPDCDIVYVQFGRVLLAKSGSDRIHYSGVGDCGNWSASGDDDYQYQDVGYKDGCDIKALIMLSTDLIVFKSPSGDDTKGIIYRILEAFPDWEQREISRDAHTFSQRTICPLGDDVLYLDKRGLKNLATVASYGDIKMASQGDKIISQLSAGSPSNARVWHIPQKGQVWVKKDSGQTIWVYSYTHKAWTSFVFAGTVEPLSVATDGVDVYVGCSDGKIYKMDSDSDSDAGTDFTSTLKYKRISSNTQLVITEFGVRLKGTTTGSGTLQVGNDSLGFTFDPGGDIAYDDEDYAYDDEDYPVVETEVRRIKRTNLRGFEFTPELVVTSGKMELKEIWFNYAEV